MTTKAKKTNPNRNLLKEESPQKSSTQNIESHENKPKTITMEKWYYIATYILAFVAVAGFLYSINSSNKSSKTLNLLAKSLTSFVEPVIKYSSIRFVPDPPQINCDQPPKIINCTYKNTSNIPIKVLVTSINITYGDIPMHSGTRPNPPKEPSLLAPGEPWGLTIGIDEEVRNMMRNKTNMFTPPLIRLDFKAKISTLDELKKYDVHLEHLIGVDCNNYSSGYNVTTVRESYVKISDK